jgi:hypothetical protein
MINQKKSNFEKENNQKPFLSKKNFKRLILAHHPNCDRFKNHTFKIGRYQFCIGCFIGYPTAIIGIIVIRILNLTKLLDSIYFIVIALPLIATFLFSPLNLTKLKIIKIIQKFLIGLGSSFLFWWILILPNPIHINIIIFFLIFGPLMIILNAYHAYGFYKECKRCEFAMNWNSCPGFK